MGVSVRPDPSQPPPTLDWHGTDRYEILQCLGRGGMGVVYEARDRESGQHLALKTLLNATPSALYLFKQEFRALADVDHPNLVRLHEFVMTESDRVFFTMELVRGIDFVSYAQGLGQQRSSQRPAPALVSGVSDSRTAEPSSSQPAPANRAKKRAPADFERLRPALRQLVEGVMALHVARKLHRDIKPSNVLVTAEGRVVVLDFGVATELSRVVDEEMHDDEEQMVGTAAYMAPEQAFEEPSPACDWYSVGTMLYEAIVGRPPFTGPALDVLTMKTTVDPLPPSECVDDVPPDLDALCRALLQREPAMRPPGPEILRRLGVVLGPRTEPAASGVMVVSEGGEGAESVGLIGRGEHLRALHDAFEATLLARTVTVRVGGRSGMGKSAVVHRFLDELVEQGSAVVLRGRAYEREAVPYKAVDGVIDALSRYLMCLNDGDLTVALPKDTWALACLFPVLRRVPGIGALVAEPVTDPQRVRRRAFLALREVFGSLARRRPLVLFVDDAQWGDTDSAALLLEVTRPPHAPPLLLAMTYREEDEHASPFLRELAARWPDQGEIRNLTVGPLDFADAKRLAHGLLGARGDSADASAEAIARESGGSPFLVEELSRNLASQAGIPVEEPATAARGTLERMVSERIDRLPDDARRLLEIVAVSGRPVPIQVATDASGIRGSPGEVVSLLRARRFIRTGLRGGREVLEVIHGRIRDTIVAGLAPVEVREHHDRLARALEADGDSDAEALATHLLGAGRSGRAAQFAERAAEQAVATLAFDQAAHLLRLALEGLPASSPDGFRLRKRLGEVLEWAGRSAEAGRVYLEAAEGAPPDQKLHLQRAAAEQFHASGLMNEGTRVLRGVLAAVGVWEPRSSLSAFLWYVVQLLWLRLVGMRFRAREVPPEEKLRLEALNAVALGFALVDHILGVAMKARLLVAALRAGDRLNIARGAIFAASDLANYTGAMGRTERAFRDLAERVAEDEPVAKYSVRLVSGLILHYRGRFREAKDSLDPIQAIPTNRRVGQQSALLFMIYSMQYLGDMSELTDRYARALTDAEERGNLFLSVALRTSVAASVWLAADDPDRARRELREAMAQWAPGKFSTPEVRAAVGEAEVDLYVGDVASAYERAKNVARAMKKAFNFAYHNWVLVDFVQGRAVVASLRGLPPSARGARLREARGLARRVRSKRMPWTAPLAWIIEAGAALAAGQRAAAESALREAITGADAAGLALHAAAARHELGLLLGGDEGAAMVRKAAEAMATRGVSAPSRYAAMIVPGMNEVARGTALGKTKPEQASSGAARGAIEQMMSDRVERLPPDAIRLLHVVAVSGRPVPTSVAIEAADVRQMPEEVISLLRSERFVRAGVRGGREVLEILHGPIRDVIVAGLAPGQMRELHARLARVLEHTGDADVDSLAAHLFGAGLNERAAQFAERAAEQAAGKLAFDQAAHLLRMTIAELPPSSADGVRLRKRLGEILEWAGRSAEAGRIYLEAAEGAPALQKLDLQRAAAEQLHASGLMDEGTGVLYGVLAAVGERAPRSPFAAWLLHLGLRLWLHLVGLRFREREVPAQVRLRLDTIGAVGVGFAFVDSILAQSMKMRWLIASLRAGDRLNASRAAAAVANDRAGNGGPETETTRALFALSSRLAEEDGSPIAKMTYRTMSGLAPFLRGRFKEALEALDPLQAMATNRRAAQQSSLLYTLSSIHYLGDMKDLTERYMRALAEADERSNRFMSVAVRTSAAAPVWLAADDPERARRELRAAMAEWAQSRFNNQEWRAIVYGAEIDLYVGDAAAAYERVRGLSRALKKSFFVFVHYVRVLTAFIQGRAAVASLRGLSGAARRSRLTEARGHALLLERERMPWSDALASIVRAAVEHAAGNGDRAVAALRSAIDSADKADLALHAAAARHELGLLLGGDEGAALAREAERAMSERGVSAPSAYAAMLVPGLRG